LERENIVCVICGSKTDHEACAQVAALSKDSINAAGRLSIEKLTALLQDSMFYFGNDTGIAHLSMAVGVTTMTVMGVGHFGRFFPYPDQKNNIAIFDPHAPCMNDNWQCIQGRTDKPAPCIESVSVEAAWDKIQAFLDKGH